MHVVLVFCALIAFVVPVPADATLPGRNGKIAYFDFDLEAETERLVTVNAQGPLGWEIAEFDTINFAFSPRGDLAAVDGDDGGLALGRVSDLLDSEHPMLATVTRVGRCDADMQPRWSRSGRELIFERLFGYLCDSQRPSNAIFRIAVGSSDPRQVGRRFRPQKKDFAEGDLLAPDWSSKGEILFQHAKPRGPGGPRPSLYKMNRAGNRVQRLTKGHDDKSPSWSPNGAKIAFVRTGKKDCGQIHVIDRTGTGLRRVADRCYDTVVWSPDGKLLAGARSTGFGYLDVMSVRGGPARLITRGDLIRSPDWQPVPR